MCTLVHVTCRGVNDLPNPDLETPDLKTTALFGLHEKAGGKIVPFAGYAMPVQFPLGVMKEHLWTRAHAGLFDVGHMGQALLRPVAGADVATALEALVPGNIAGLKPGQIRYTLLLNEAGGIRDDLMVTRCMAEPDTLYLVVNAACKHEDFPFIMAALNGVARLEVMETHALVALQGPDAVAALEGLLPGVGDLQFMRAADFGFEGETLMVSRSGYTGEDGYEISLPNAIAERFAGRLMADERVEPIGLGARDSLRLEAGLPLYGHDIDTTTSPIEAGLGWTLPKRRREAANFPGAARILNERENGPVRLRVGIRPDGRAPAREGTAIVSDTGEPIGRVTSGGFGPSVGGPIAMGYVSAAHAEVGTVIGLQVRGKTLPARVVEMPFVTKSYVR